MHQRERFPHDVVTVEHVTIPMPDGCRLAARLWLPAGADTWPVPGVLEYIPYRKRDGTRSRDTVMHRYLAGHGYACVRVDLRGSGDSEGLLVDEYLEQELADGEAVLAWMAEQRWCDGRIGIIGKSWGGFNGLQLASRRPPELGAVVTVCSTDDRYADDVHYMGGCLLGDNLSWASVMFAYTSCPPDPELVEDWRETWMERLWACEPWISTWLTHQHRDEYWEHGSVCEDFSSITCPVMVVSGWADGYSNAVFRLLENLDVPRQGLIGPWGHRYPHRGVPGPAIGFLQEVVRWFDRWLKDEDNGVTKDPMLTVWLQDSVRPTPLHTWRPGRWITEDVWPSPAVEPREWGLGFARLAEPGEQVDRPDLSVQSPLSTGLYAGKWCSYTGIPDMPHDQREDDGGSLVFETAPLEVPLDILGAPVLDLEVSANRPVAMVAARISDVAPDGSATRVTYGVLNLTHRDSHRHPQPLVPGVPVRVSIRLDHIAQRFPAGHRIRLAVSSSYWPLAWPSPEPVRVTVHTAHSTLALPCRPVAGEAAGDDEQDADIERDGRVFGDAEGAPPPRMTTIKPGQHTWRVLRDLATDESTLEVINDDGTFRIDEIDLELTAGVWEWYSSRGSDPTSARGETRAVKGYRRGDWSVRTETRTVLTADAEAFRVRAELDAWEGDTRVFSRNWDTTIPRVLL